MSSEDYLVRSLVAKRVARSLVNQLNGMLELLRLNLGKVGFLGKELSDEPIAVFVRRNGEVASPITFMALVRESRDVQMMARLASAYE